MSQEPYDSELKLLPTVPKLIKTTCHISGWSEISKSVVVSLQNPWLKSEQIKINNNNRSRITEEVEI